MRLVFDIEANGFYDKADTVWCIVAQDLDSTETYEFKPDELDKGLELLSKASELIGHNIINYDIPLLEKIHGWRPKEDVKITDTLVMSRLAYPDRPRPFNYTGKGGPHSLEAWGYRVGKGKPDHSEWDVFSTAMLRRCREDVGINALTYYSISSELSDGFPQEAIDLEMAIAKIISDQEHYGIRFDKPKAEEYLEQLTKMVEDIDAELIPKLPKELEVIGTTVTKPFKVNGEYTKQIQKYIDEVYEDARTICEEGSRRNVIGGPFTRVRFNTFDLGSIQKVKSYLLDNGWRPEEWNYSKLTGERTSPKLDGDFEGVSGDLPQKVKRRISCEKQRSILKGWLTQSKVQDTLVTLPAGANTCGAATHRMTHYVVCNVPRPTVDKETHELVWDVDKQDSFFGTQMRSLFIPRDGHVMVGHDASGLELRMLAHYLNDKEFTQEILNGDIHTFNQERAGLPTRDAAKTFIYALIYGAGDEKIGGIIGEGAKEGKEIKKKYFTDLPSLSRFIKNVKRAAAKGYVKGPDGRKVLMRRDSQGRIETHKAPNTLLQHAGIVVMKRSCVILWDEVKRRQIAAQKVLDMHDEGQAEVLNNESNIELYCDTAVSSIVQAGEYYNLNIPLDAEAKVGMSWAQTH